MLRNAISFMPEATCQFQHCLQKKRCASLTFMFFENFRDRATLWLSLRDAPPAAESKMQSFIV